MATNSTENPLGSIDLSGLNNAELDELMQKANEAKAERLIAQLEPLRQEYADVVQKINDAVKGYGLTAASYVALSSAQLRRHMMTRLDAAGDQRGRRVSRVPARYRNPENSEQTWTGRGNKPHWVREFEATGASLASIEITT